MYEKSFRLRGKTYDYKIQYESIKKFMVLPKPDDIHTLITIGLDPPLRQGQTRYPFLVMQFKRDEEVNLDLNMTDDALEDKYYAPGVGNVLTVDLVTGERDELVSITTE